MDAGLRFPPIYLLNQPTCSLAAISHLAIFAQQDMPAAENRFNGIESSRLIPRFEHHVHVNVEPGDADASPS